MKVVGIPCPLKLGKHASITGIHFPLSLGVLLAYLRKHNFDIELWDYNVKSYTKKSFIEKLRRSKPKVVGLAATTPSINSAHELATVIKENSPETITIIGGPHIDALPEKTMEEFPNFDIGVYGEAEETFLELCKRIEKKKSLNGCKGIVHRKKEKIIMEKPHPLIENLDELPYAARDIVNFDDYRKAHVERGLSRKFMNIMEFMTARGCPARCIFCGSGANKPPKVRYRSLKNLLGEIDECVEKYGTTYVNLVDDTFTLNKNYVREFCKAMKSRGLEWGCNTRADCVTKELLKEMVDSGCLRISFGVESGSPRIMALNGKAINLDKVREAFKWAHEVGLRIIDATFIIGSHPDENYEDIRKSIKLIKQIKPTFLSVTVVVPIPGTALYDMMKKEGLILAEDWSKFAFIGEEPSWRTRHFSPKELVRLQKYVLRKSYFRPGFLISLFTRVRSWNEFRYFLDIGWGSFKEIILNKN